MMVAWVSSPRTETHAPRRKSDKTQMKALDFMIASRSLDEPVWSSAVSIRLEMYACYSRRCPKKQSRQEVRATVASSALHQELICRRQAYRYVLPSFRKAGNHAVSVLAACCSPNS